MHLLNARQLSRRTLLRTGAVSIGLPLLDAMMPLGLRAEAKAAALRPKRMLLVARNLGCVDEHLFPKTTGLDYEAPRYLKLLQKYRGKFTVISGTSHLGYPNSHHTEAGLFTGAEASRMQRGDDIRATISLDQFAVERLPRETRFPFVLAGNCGTPMIYNRDGVPVPSELSCENLFLRMFVDGKPEEVSREVRRLQDGRSILDGVRNQLNSLGKSVGAGDRNRLDLLGTSIREAEQQLATDEAWAAKPKPKVDRKPEDFRNPNWSSSQRMRYDLLHLAFQTDLTRIAVAMEGEGGADSAPGATITHHDASHHGQDPAKIEQLAKFEEEETRNIGVLLDKLSACTSGDGTLLDDTIVCWASNIGNASAHASNNLPIFIAGGGFKHQGHVAFDRASNYPLSNVYVRILHQMGIEADKFGSSTGIFSELG